jgi:ATP-binding cassette, subfamily C, bacterial CydC
MVSLYSRLDDRNHKLYAAERARNQLEALSLMSFHLCAGFFIVALFWMSPQMIATGLTAPMIIFLNFGLLGVLNLLTELPFGLQSLGTIKFSAKRLRALDHMPVPIQFPKSSPPLPYSLDLHFHQVSFSYPGSIFPVLTEFEASIFFGEHVGLTGPSGSGKSSLAHLALRLLEPTKGEILLGHIPLGHFSESDLRSTISLVSQSPHLFQNSVRYNVSLGRKEACDEAIWDMLEIVQLAEEIRALPDQLDTWLGAQGAKLSGGQQKRLAIARALLYHPSILILDEPTEGLDRQTAQRLIHNIQHYYQAKTLCIISHTSEDLKSLYRLINISETAINKTRTSDT